MNSALFVLPLRLKHCHEQRHRFHERAPNENRQQPNSVAAELAEQAPPAERLPAAEMAV
jgi:hypothetical protein